MLNVKVHTGYPYKKEYLLNSYFHFIRIFSCRINRRDGVDEYAVFFYKYILYSMSRGQDEF
jgi:hypothetical protein